jgi:hypothetical protein
MEGLLLTALLIGGMVLALALLGRTWPRSSRLGGYRARQGSADSAGPDEPGPLPPEDDDARWRWTPPRDGDPNR